MSNLLIQHMHVHVPDEDSGWWKACRFDLIKFIFGAYFAVCRPTFINYRTVCVPLDSSTGVSIFHPVLRILLSVSPRHLNFICSVPVAHKDRFRFITFQTTNSPFLHNTFVVFCAFLENRTLEIMSGRTWERDMGQGWEMTHSEFEPGSPWAMWPVRTVCGAHFRVSHHSTPNIVSFIDGVITFGWSRNLAALLLDQSETSPSQPVQSSLRCQCKICKYSASFYSNRYLYIGH